MNRLVAVPPSPDLVPAFRAFVVACTNAGEDHWEGRNALAHADPHAFAELLRRRRAGDEIPNGWVWEITYWIVDEAGAVVGELELRPQLNDWLREVGGNAGYLTHPQHRNRGIATFALREALRFLAELGVAEALVTCREDNLASIRVIEKCGGRRVRDAALGGAPRRRYLIATT